MLRPFRLLLDPQGGPEGGSPAPAPSPTPTPSPSPAPAPAGDPTEGYKKLLEKHQNDVGQVAAKLYDENHTYRQTIRDLKGKVPSEGSMVLTPDQAKAWAAYLELGKPEDLGTLKTEHGQFAQQAKQAAKEKLHGEIAEAHGYKASVLSRLIDQDNLEVVELKEGPDKDVKTGKLLKVAYVKDGAKTVALPDYAKAHWDDFLAALPKVPPAAPIGTPRTGAGLPPAAGQPQGQPRKSLVS